MSCPTCDHTLELLTQDGKFSVRYFLCPRCGTVRMEEEGLGGQIIVQEFVPTLVERCREFEKTFTSNTPFSRNWHTIGIRESINKPEDRP